MSNPMERPGYDALWGWFSLSRAAWLTVPRVLMHEMPDQWQADMARLLREINDTFPNFPAVSTVVMVKKGNRFTQMPEWVGNYRRPDLAEVEKCRETERS